LHKKHAAAATALQGCMRRCFTEQFQPTPPIGVLIRACLSEPPPPIDWHTVLQYVNKPANHAAPNELQCACRTSIMHACAT
jgi:hypothetical protein